MKVRYIFCNSKSEVPLKSMFKGIKTKILYCIVDEEVFVYQGFKTIPISMELFAEGMGIDLFEAQRIISNRVLWENLNTDVHVESNMKIVDDVKDFTQIAVEKSKDVVDTTKTSVSDTIMFNPGQLVKEVDELVPDKVKDLPNIDLLDRIQELEYKVDMIMEHLGMNDALDDEAVEETVVEDVVIED